MKEIEYNNKRKREKIQSRQHINQRNHERISSREERRKKTKINSIVTLEIRGRENNGLIMK
jgi:hypothetical protein